MINIIGGKQIEQYLARETVKWCLEYFGMDWHEIKVRVKLKNQNDCAGSCVEGRQKHSYNVEIAKNQSLRDFVATIVHEMIHVKQWETGKCSGDGEKECERLQYTLTDKLWKSGKL